MFELHNIILKNGWKAWETQGFTHGWGHQFNDDLYRALTLLQEFVDTEYANERAPMVEDFQAPVELEDEDQEQIELEGEEEF